MEGNFCGLIWDNIQKVCLEGPGNTAKDLKISGHRAQIWMGCSEHEAGEVPARSWCSAICPKEEENNSFGLQLNIILAERPKGLLLITWHHHMLRDRTTVVLWGLRFSQQWQWRGLYFGIWGRLVWYTLFTDVPPKHRQTSARLQGVISHLPFCKADFPYISHFSITPRHMWCLSFAM
jgi:hypothetical protein